MLVMNSFTSLFMIVIYKVMFYNKQLKKNVTNSDEYF